MKIELRDEGTLCISGYVNAVERQSELLPKSKGAGAPGDFKERIKEGAFADSLSRLPAVKLTFNHGKIIGENGRNLILTEDNIGLRAEATVDEEETVAAAKAGLLTGWSFGMTNVSDRYVKQADGTFERDVNRLDLTEVSLLTRRPAYHTTTVELRNGAAVEMRNADDLPEVSAEELEKISSYSRRRLKAEEVYIFSVMLCDNEIDRDCERFSVAALIKLAELFEGKTGIFDHDASGRNQTARIFDTEVIADESRQTSQGEPYTGLYAKAYMMRTETNADLIREIDGGIKKEVSVSLSARKKYCSVCGRDLGTEPCEHIKGRYYGDKRCHHIISEPTDAYEWSFVAVPAQPKAGVTKTSGREDTETIKAINAARQREIEILRLKGKMYNEN